jgi:hypothetical protein
LILFTCPNRLTSTPGVALQKSLYIFCHSGPDPESSFLLDHYKELLG